MACSPWRSCNQRHNADKASAKSSDSDQASIRFDCRPHLVQIDVNPFNFREPGLLSEIVDIERVAFGANDQRIRRKGRKVLVQLVDILQVFDAKTDGVDEHVTRVPLHGLLGAGDVEDSW